MVCCPVRRCTHIFSYKKTGGEMAEEEVKFTEEELKHSKRIFKSATPKYTPDWYIKWVASVLLLIGMSLRGIEGYGQIDLTFSCVGIFLWLIISVMWNDRALIVLNAVGLALLLRNALEKLL